ncbi:DUF5691 domain-containing protein [Nocardioides sp. TF02-7]|uniref:DUF5691 domain-containing protein n=1 Tax=Nocardioides sp. TF02-7 TaxID=2917724 RepID=UPI001F067354|nr:DUF5691 domain-containing protein [Nocardioides sp. TF02-7]UMG94613.1 DUF5691 domain-containing protein [Nocardioides sp. TF02-7]
MLPPAPPAAVQLLELLLHQPPVRAELVPVALGAWLAAAQRRGVRVPHPVLPALLALATRRRELREPVAAVVDARGRWLARLDPDWAWAATPDGADGADGAGDAEAPVDAPDPLAWGRLPTPARVATVARLRASDPDVARELVESAWRDDPAATRLALLETLETSLGPADEELLERALDDRARSVRERAQQLLDGLPGSARAQRMADRLRPLLRTTGRVRRSLEVELPADPGPAGVRDGLGTAPRHRSRRGFHLERIAAAAPLAVWTEVTGRDAAGTWPMVRDADARRGIAAAVRAQRDLAWARAVVADVPALLDVLPADERERVAVSLLRPGSTYDPLALARVVPPPWGADLSRLLVERLMDRKGTPDAPTLALARGLHPDVLPLLRAWEARKHGWHDLPRDLVRHLALVTAIPEAFR